MQVQKENLMMGLQSHPFHLAQVLPAAKKCLMGTKWKSLEKQSLHIYGADRKNPSKIKTFRILKRINMDLTAVKIINNCKNLY